MNNNVKIREKECMETGWLHWSTSLWIFFRQGPRTIWIFFTKEWFLHCSCLGNTLKCLLKTLLLSESQWRVSWADTVQLHPLEVSHDMTRHLPLTHWHIKYGEKTGHSVRKIIWFRESFDKFEYYLVCLFLNIIFVDVILQWDGFKQTVHLK